MAELAGELELPGRRRELKEDKPQEIRIDPGRHKSELYREGSDCVQASDQGVDQRRRVERAVRLAGEFSSGSKDVSAEHDRYLGEGFGR